MLDKFKTIANEAQAQIIQKKSKFICYIQHIESEEAALDYIAGLKKKYYDARHHCSAYCIGLDEHATERFNDDGEPSGTAGKPILEVLKGAGMKNVVAVVIRYFGGVLLGTGGLIKAYTDATQAALESACVYESLLCEKVELTIDYHIMSKINHLLHQYEQLIYETVFLDKVNMTLFLSSETADKLKKEFVELSNGQCIIKSDGYYYVGMTEDKVIVNKLL